MKFAIWFGVLSVIVSGCAQTPQDCSQLPHHQARANAGCLVIQSGNLLMMQQHLGDKWSIPGGGNEPGERAVCTAARETREETGINVTVERELAVMDNGFYVFLCQAQQPLILDPQDRGEVKQAAWLNQEQRQSVEWRFPQQKHSFEILLQQLSAESN